MVEIRNLKLITGVLVLALIIPTIIFMVLIANNQASGFNPNFQDDTPYDFKIQNEVVNVYIKEDGRIDIEYYINFYAYGYSIPIVDIGFPNGYYDFNSVQATIDGNPISASEIRNSEYLLVGVEIHLGSDEIGSYSSGLLHVKGSNPIMVFKDDLAPLSLASVEFSPTWFSSSFCRCVDHLTVNFYFPENFTDLNSVKTHYTSYTSYSLNATQLIWTWQLDNVPSQQYTFGVSFPNSAVNTVYDSWLYGLFSPTQKVIFDLILMAVILVGLIVIYFSYIKYRKTAKYRYYKPSVSIECIGIERDFTAVEAGIILGIRLDRVISLIIFGLIRKNLLRIVSIEPLLFEKIIADSSNLQSYESSVLNDGLIRTTTNNDGPYEVNNSALKIMSSKLIKDVNNTMKGYSRKDTESYYTGLMEQAYKDINKADIGNYNEEKLSEEFEWMLLEFKPKKIEEDYKDRDIIVPYWYYHYYYFHFLGQKEYQIPAGNLTPTTSVKLNGLEFASNIEKAVEKFCNSVIKDLTAFIDSVQEALFPPPAPPPEQSEQPKEKKQPKPRQPAPHIRYGRAGGGRGCACACACACAGCACACAGGGR